MKLEAAEQHMKMRYIFDLHSLFMAWSILKHVDTPS